MKLNSIYTHPEVIMCDEEIGGCGRYLAIEVSVKTKARVYSMQEKEQ